MLIEIKTLNLWFNFNFKLGDYGLKMPYRSENININLYFKYLKYLYPHIKTLERIDNYFTNKEWYNKEDLKSIIDNVNNLILLQGKIKNEIIISGLSAGYRNIDLRSLHGWLNGDLIQIIKKEEQEKREQEKEKLRIKKEIEAGAGWLYVLETSNPSVGYKIGKSKNIEKRKIFQIKTPFEYKFIIKKFVRGYGEYERQLHKHFWKKRLNGSEFFNLNEDDIKYIQQFEVSV